MLRIETVVHNTKELRSLRYFPEIVIEAKGILERFMNALSCIDQCFIADRMLEQLPEPSQVGKTKVGGIDLNKPRMRWVIETLLALSPLPGLRPRQPGPGAQQAKRIGLWPPPRRL